MKKLERLPRNNGMERIAYYGRFLSLPTIKLQSTSTFDTKTKENRRHSESASSLKRAKHRSFNGSGIPNRESRTIDENAEATIPSSEVAVKLKLRPLYRGSTSFVLTRSLSVYDPGEERKRTTYKVKYIFKFGLRTLQTD